MATMEETTRRLKESRPPATDRFTYLTIMEKSLSPEILPTLEEILEDVELTSDIGWDLVEMLIPLAGSENCLETIARLGNPREVILKVLQVMDTTAGEGGDGAEGNRAFVTLCGMLGILHGRLQVKEPSRFLHTTLDTVYRSYDPTSAETTAAVIALVRSLSGQKRPLLPSRPSSTRPETAFRESDPARSAPDPEADASDKVGADEPELARLLLQSFVSCVIEAYVNSNNMEWAARLLEYTYPERIVQGRMTMMQAFKETDELGARDALVGQLVAAAGDVGLSRVPFSKLKEAVDGPVCKEPLAMDFDPQRPQDVKPSTGGLICLVAYCIFAADVFDADQPLPEMHLFPDHDLLMKQFLGDDEDPQAQVSENPGTVEALVAVAIWLHGREHLTAGAGTEANFMSYHHTLTLVSVFHPNVRVRNAATVVAGLVLHADPDEEDRLGILEDLLENCMFSSLQACAVTWLREEIIAARKAESKGRFNSPDCLEALQYTLFPSLTHLKEADTAALMDFWGQTAPLLLQAANFALFLYGGTEYGNIAPAGMAAAIEHRYVEPLQQAAKSLSAEVAKEGLEAQTADPEMLMQLGILSDTLSRVPLQ
ncbi:DUF1760-domain-containing protein [Drechmeria coniospora]|uniref:DUF1760-domain-containing protein n=1 Tax=Drechmeria coniospora TaxID=98403 RepID=A0A151GXC8_DRECN|nr:DUF1760-domain-containing protein [Drechmeria coniospora]KYK61756.1 DUF1760-domain-containing protein [Drechmeria coniospora]